ncbi:hypothetical protein C3424_05425 [Citrobacter amalonaticus]|nr:hypothetical protein C3424_05425 [Citrobacter amalonaticus]
MLNNGDYIPMEKYFTSRFSFEYPLLATEKYFRLPLDRRKIIRLFSKRATIVAASLGRSGR